MSQSQTWKGNPAIEPFLVAVDSLSPDPANARFHSALNLIDIRESLTTYGQQKPIVVRAGIVKAGNGTFAAARMAGWSHIAAIESDLEGAALVAYAIRDNHTGDGSEWSQDVLGAILSGLREDGFDVEATGFTEAEADALIAAAGGPGDEPDDEPGADDDGGDEVPMVGFLRWGTVEVPMIESEAAGLTALYDRHVADRGTPVGFAASLIRSASAL